MRRKSLIADRDVAPRAVYVSVFCVCLGVCFSRVARADTLEAPVGGKPIALGAALVACVSGAGGWRVESGGHAIRPPAGDAAIGVSVELPVALAPADCPRTTTTVRLVSTGPWPALDPSSFTLFLDEGRLEGRGRGLHGMLITWPTEAARASDSCRDLTGTGGPDACAWGVPKTLSADPSASALRWLPAGAQVAPDAAMFDAEGRLAAPETFGITPSRVELMDLLPSDASVDVSSGTGRTRIEHGEAVTGADCGGAALCRVDSGSLVVQAPPASVTTVDVKFHLLPHVFYSRKKPPDPQPTIHVSILRCPMSVASGPPLRGVDTARAVVRLEGACARDVGALRFFVGGRPADVTQVENVKDAAYAVLDVGSVEAPTISITAVHGEGDTAVAVARTDTRAAPVVRTVLQIAGFPPVDFIPNNRLAVVHQPRVAGAEIVLLPIDDVYEATNDMHGGAQVSMVKGDVNAVGSVALRFGYRVPTLPPPLDGVNLAVLSDPLHRAVKEANIPAPFGTSALAADPLVELVCTDVDGKVRRIPPGLPIHLSFAAREGCRIILHRERMSPEYGTQKLNLEIQVDKLDGSVRAEGHLNQTVILRAGSEPRVAWIKGVVSPYDRVLVRLSHVADEAHYLNALDIPTGAPMVQWSVVLGTGRVRLYATTAIPTGLYRFGTPDTSGVLSLSLGVITRFTWLDTDGHEGLLGLEAGLMAFGLTGDTSTTGGQPLTQVGAVLGVGLSIPIAGAGSPTQASINLHAWAEQRITGSGPEAASSRAIIFGPSISLGNVGTTF
jgi:hypothetical protein